MTILKCEALCAGYMGKAVVENLNFSVNKGDYLCVLGQNGSGKSTLIKTLLGLEKPISGKIIKENALQIGYMPQSTELQTDFPATVKEIVLSGVLHKKKFFCFYDKKDLLIAKENMQKLGIYHLKNKKFGALSGGQQQRVLLARALCATKTLLLLDEPVTGLDPTATREMYELIYHLNIDHKITVIMVSHDIAASVKYASHILHMKKNGVFFGTKEEYLSSDLAKDFIKDGENNA